MHRINVVYWPPILLSVFIQYTHPINVLELHKCIYRRQQALTFNYWTRILFYRYSSHLCNIAKKSLTFGKCIDYLFTLKIINIIFWWRQKNNTMQEARSPQVKSYIVDYLETGCRGNFHDSRHFYNVGLKLRLNIYS